MSIGLGSLPYHNYSSGGIAIKLWAGQPRNYGSFPGEDRFSYSLMHPDWLWGPYSLQWVTGVPSFTVKWPGLETDHYSLSTSKFQNE